MIKQKEKLEKMIDSSQRIVFFGGAGVSTESGIPDFRSPAGLYQKEKSLQWPAEIILSHDFFQSQPLVFYQYYRQYIVHPEAKPNPAHIRLAELEKEGKLIAIITQNIDGLHQAAGSKHVLELHGSIHSNTCQKCGKKYGLDKILSGEDIPTCHCGGIIKPDVVLYGEELNQQVMNEAIEAIAQSDLLIVGGTSLMVYPAASLLHYAVSCRIVIINQTPTPYDQRADLVIRGPIGEVLGLPQMKDLNDKMEK